MQTRRCSFRRISIPSGVGSVSEKEFELNLNLWGESVTARFTDISLYDIRLFCSNYPTEDSFWERWFSLAVGKKYMA
jgi:hypothetical protein